MAPCVFFFVMSVDRLPQEMFKGWARNTTQSVGYMPSMIQKPTLFSILHKPGHNGQYLKPQNSWVNRRIRLSGSYVATYQLKDRYLYVILYKNIYRHTNKMQDI